MRLAPLPVRATRLRALAAALAVVPVAAYAGLPLQPGLYELRVTTTVMRQTAPVETQRACLTQQDLDHPTRSLPKLAADCAITQVETAGNRVTYDLACRQDTYVNRGRMELVVGGAGYDGMADMKVSAPGNKDTPMTVVLNAKRVGDCPP